MTNNHCGANYGNRSIKELFVDLVVLIAGLGARGHWWPWGFFVGGEGGTFTVSTNLFCTTHSVCTGKVLGYRNTQTLPFKRKAIKLNTEIIHLDMMI